MTGAPTFRALADAWSRPDPKAVPVLAAEYERLFVGPGPVPCPPYESWWRQDGPPALRGALMGPCVDAVVALYSRLGLRLAPGAAELPDHVAVELEALAVAESSAESQGVAAALVDEHLALWLPAFCRAVAAATSQEHYRKLAETTAARFAA